MKTIRTLLATISMLAIFTGCNEPERATVPATIANSVWGNFTVQIDAYQKLSFSADECMLEVFPKEDYDRFETPGAEAASTQKWRYTYTKPVLKLIPLDGNGETWFGEVTASGSAKLTLMLHNEDKSQTNTFWSM